MKRDIIVIYKPQPIDYEPLICSFADCIQDQLERGIKPKDLFKEWEMNEPVYRE
jgi:hypothetical protein